MYRTWIWSRSRVPGWIISLKIFMLVRRVRRGVDNWWSWNWYMVPLDITMDQQGTVGIFPDDPRSVKSMFMKFDFWWKILKNGAKHSPPGHFSRCPFGGSQGGPPVCEPGHPLSYHISGSISSNESFSIWTATPGTTDSFVKISKHDEKLMFAKLIQDEFAHH